jgi:predicted TIM-barrel fold metal-dependent hydrolase
MMFSEAYNDGAARPISRRALLGMALAAPALAAGPPILDAHVHFYDPSRPGGVPWPPRTDSLLYRTVLPADFRKVTSGLGVAGVVVIEASPLLEDNQWILDLAKRNPLIAAFIGRLDPGSADFPKQLDRFMAGRLFRGIRLSAAAIAEGLKTNRFIDGIRRLGKRGLTLDAIGPASMFPDLLRIAEFAPGLKIVIDHLPFGSQPGLPRHPHIYAKVSGVRPETPPSQLDELWDVFGPERVVYGSNWPVSERVAPYREILRIVTAYFAARGPEALAGYLHRNSRAAYGWRAMPQ